MSGLIFWFCIIFILYVYAGYPILLGFITTIIRHPVAANPITPSVTLLIAAYNEESVIKAKLENCFSLDYPQEKLQILVAADGSSDRTVEIVKSFEELGVVLSFDQERRGKMFAINRAMMKARHDIVVLSDANNMYEAGTLRELVKPFSDANVGAVSGSKEVMDEDGLLSETESLYWKYESFIKERETWVGSCTGVAGEILAIRRNLYILPPPNVINDDFFIGMQVIRQGYRLVYAPAARSFERVSLNAHEEIIRRTRIVAGRYQAIGMSLFLLPWRSPLTVWQIVSHKFMRPLVPFAMIAALFAGVWSALFPSVDRPEILYLAPPYHFMFLGLQGCFYLLACIGGLLKINGFLGKLLYLPTFLVNSNLAALNGFFKYITGRQTVIWQRVARRD